MKKIKKCDVAGQFYPSDPIELSRSLDNYYQQAKTFDMKAYAIIAPHAGNIFSGPIALTAYRLIETEEETTVLLLSPSHNYGFPGVALSDADEFETPLGNIAVNKELNKSLGQFDFASILPQAFTPEHSLETHLPLIKKYLPHASIVPIICGKAAPKDIAKLLSIDTNAIIIISSDLSHFHTYKEAQKIDHDTSQIIQSLDCTNLTGERACGHTPISGLCHWAHKNGLSIKELDLRNSGDTAGDREQVVGYGSFAVY